MTNKPLSEGQIYKGRLAFQVPPFTSGECEVEIIKRGEKALAICTEMYDNPGRSIDNAPKSLLTALLIEFDLDPANLTVIFRYGWFSYAKEPDAYSSKEADRLQTITFDYSRKEHGSFKISNVQRARVDEAYVRSLQNELLSK